MCLHVGLRNVVSGLPTRLQLLRRIQKKLVQESGSRFSAGLQLLRIKLGGSQRQRVLNGASPRV